MADESVLLTREDAATAAGDLATVADLLGSANDRVLLTEAAEAFRAGTSEEVLDRLAGLVLSRAGLLHERVDALEREVRDDVAALEEEHLNLESELDAVARRHRGLLEAIRVARHEARAAVEASYQRALAEFAAELPGVLTRTVLPSWQDGWRGRAANRRQRDRLAGELGTVVQERAVRRLEEWSALNRRILTARFKAVAGETEAALRDLATAYDDTFHRVGAWQPRAARPWADRSADVTRAWKIGAAVLSAATPDAPATTVPAAVVAAVAAATATMETLAGTYLEVGWPELAERLDVYRTELLAATSSAFDTLRADAERMVDDLAGVETARVGDARAALTAAYREHARDLDGLDAYRYRIDLSASALRRLLAKSPS
ncbi:MULTISPECIES: hypothetical protein [Actinoplanes]|uniref:hypothetical protein n=1 Tax=Actinoplanes TaxID=1865 RepID=UPI0005F2D780|nr:MULTISPECIES: hypothetical protein [Actinoplanes]GLY03942.1 hypothetical protein Acsp01_43210 [Actinoplanes sp. NBRC 101535]